MTWPRRTRRPSPTVVNVPVTITPPAGPTLLEQRWRDARVAVLDKEHPTAINTSSPYVS